MKVKNKLFKSVEINKDYPNEKNRGCLFRACYSKGVGHCDLCWAESTRQAKECKRLRMRRGRKALSVLSLEDTGMWKLEVS